jgi:hypothetical protein
VGVDGAWGCCNLVAMRGLGVGGRKVGEFYYLIFAWDYACMYHCGYLKGCTADGVLACVDDVVLLTIDCVVSEGSWTLNP